MCKLKPLLQKWLADADGTSTISVPNFNCHDLLGKRRKKRTSIENNIRYSLEKAFLQNPKPTSEEVRKISDTLYLEKEVVRVWFCNRWVDHWIFQWIRILMLSFFSKATEREASDSWGPGQPAVLLRGPCAGQLPAPPASGAQVFPRSLWSPAASELLRLLWSDGHGSPGQDRDRVNTVLLFVLDLPKKNSTNIQSNAWISCCYISDFKNTLFLLFYIYCMKTTELISEELKRYYLVPIQ